MTPKRQDGFTFSALQIALALYLIMLGGCPLGCDGGSAQVNFQDLKPGAMPFVLDPDDADLKDIKLASKKTKGVFVYEEYFGGYGPKALQMSSKVDGAAATVLYDRTFTGTLTASISVAIDGTTGYADDMTRGFLEIRRPVGSGNYVRAEAVWDADIDGFVARAMNEKGQVGEPVPMPGSREVQLSIMQTADETRISAYEVIDFGDGGFAEWIILEPLAEGEFAGGFGVEELGKKGKLYFRELIVTSSDMVSGDTEAGIAVELAGASQSVGFAFGDVKFNNPSGVAANLGAASASIGMAREMLEAAVEKGDQFQPTSRVTLVRKQLKKGVKVSDSTVKKSQKLVDKGKTNTNPLYKKVNRVRWATDLSLAQLFGFKSSGVSKMYKSANWTLP